MTKAGSGRTRVPPEVAFTIAREAVRRYGPIEPRLPEKLQRNVRRNHRVTVPLDQVRRLAEHYKAAYAYAGSILPRFLHPRKGTYVDPSDVDQRGFAAALRSRYPREPRPVLEMLAWYTVFYEYLK
jgi:hypothetical protein